MDKGAIAGLRCISRLSHYRGAAGSFVMGTLDQHCGHQRTSPCHAAGDSAGDGGSVSDGRPLEPLLNGCHGLRLHSDCSLMD